MNLNEIEPARQNYGSCVIQELSRISDLADSLAKRTEDRLLSIISPTPQSTDQLKKDPQQYPPFLQEIRELTDKIERALNNIESTIKRVEI